MQRGDGSIVRGIAVGRGAVPEDESMRGRYNGDGAMRMVSYVEFARFLRGGSLRGPRALRVFHRAGGGIGGRPIEGEDGGLELRGLYVCRRPMIRAAVV